MKRKLAIVKTVDIVVSDVDRMVCDNTCGQLWAESETLLYCAQFGDEKLGKTIIDGVWHAKRCAHCIALELVDCAC